MNAQRGSSELNRQTTDQSVGVAIGQQTPFWIDTAGSETSKVYHAGASKQFAVTIPAAGGTGKTGSTSGILFNSSPADLALP